MVRSNDHEKGTSYHKSLLINTNLVQLEYVLWTLQNQFVPWPSLLWSYLKTRMHISLNLFWFTLNLKFLHLHTTSLSSLEDQRSLNWSFMNSFTTHENQRKSLKLDLESFEMHSTRKPTVAVKLFDVTQEGGR